MMKSNSNNNGKPVKRPAFHHSKNSRGMKLLYHPSTVIELGVYAGKTFGYVLNHFGKKAFPELLKYYRVSSRIMGEYHCTLKPHVEKAQEVESASVNNSVTVCVEEEVEEAINVTGQIEKEVISNDALSTTDRVEIDDDRWTMSRFDYENNVLYDPEDDHPDTNEDKRNMAWGGPHPYWSEGVSFHRGTSVIY
jgi:hypothetical protein